MNTLKLKLNQQREIESYNKMNTINHYNNDDDASSSSSSSSSKYNFNRFLNKILQNGNYNNNKVKIRKLSITNILSAAMLCVTNALLQDMNHHDDDSHSIDDDDGDHNDKMLEDLKLRFLLSVDLRPYGLSSTTSTTSTSPPPTSPPTSTATTTTAIKEEEEDNDFTRGTVACAAGAVDFIVPMTKRMSQLILPWARTTSSSTTSSSPSSSCILSSEFKDEFWQLVTQTRDLSSLIIDEFDLVPESVRLFGLGESLLLFLSTLLIL